GEASGWLEIFEKIFKKTDPSLSVFDLASMDERIRQGALSQVSSVLNKTLTQEWTKSGLDGEKHEDSRLELNIDYVQPAGGKSSDGGALRIQVTETMDGGVKRFFYLTNRSKGFYWFCNFVLKLEFNPKSAASDSGAVYLLDEPGSYLHNSAQSRLCEKLKQISEHNTVIYCTHSHYLLNPEIIPLS